MKNYGKMRRVRRSFPIQGVQIGAGPTGEPIYENAGYVEAWIYLNALDIDMIVAVLADPSNYYIAVKDDGTIISMTDDIEQSQIEGVDIIGIDSTFGYTFGQGGNVYQMVWNGSEIVDPLDLMTADEKRALMPNLSARQIRLGLNSLGKLAMVDAAIAAMPSPQKEDAQIEWEYGTEFRRLHTLITMIIPLLGLTPEEVDVAWMEFATK